MAYRKQNMQFLAVMLGVGVASHFAFEVCVQSIVVVYMLAAN